MRSGGPSRSMPRTCTGEVWVRSRLPSVQPERVLHVARRMVGRNVERVEVVIFGLHFGAVEHREPERGEQIFDFALDLRDGMQAAAARAGRGQREIEPFGVEARAQRGFVELALAALERLLRASAWRH